MPTEHQQDWDVYLTRINDEPSSVTIDLGWANEKRTRLPARIIVRLKALDGDRNGFPSAPELERLGTLGDRVGDALEAVRNVHVVGIIQAGRSRDIIAHGPAGTRIDSKTLSFVPSERRAEPFVDTELDSEWTLYSQVLFPSPTELRVMMDTRVLRNLEKHGDDSSKPRRVDHWIYFTKSIDVEQFATWCSKNGFAIDSTTDSRKRGSQRGIQIYHTSTVDADVIHPTIAKLVEAAESHNGEYDGWETAIVKHDR